MSHEDDGFLSRWSRRKRVADETPPEPAPGPEPEPAPAEHPETLTEKEIAALPRIEDLVEGADIKAFLRPGVPAPLKNAAMRRMWLLTPAIRDYRDPAVDYAWDWNTPGGVPGDGCAPSPERAAQMLRDLFDPPKPEPAAETAPVEVDNVDPAQPDAPEPPGLELPASLPQNVEDPEEAEISDAPPISRRRHGSALPS